MFTLKDKGLVKILTENLKQSLLQKSKYFFPFFLHKYICCRYSLEVFQLGTSNE